MAAKAEQEHLERQAAAKVERERLEQEAGSKTERECLVEQQATKNAAKSAQSDARRNLRRGAQSAPDWTFRLRKILPWITLAAVVVIICMKFFLSEGDTRDSATPQRSDMPRRKDAVDPSGLAQSDSKTVATDPTSVVRQSVPPIVLDGPKTSSRTVTTAAKTRDVTPERQTALRPDRPQSAQGIVQSAKRPAQTTDPPVDQPRPAEPAVPQAWPTPDVNQDGGRSWVTFAAKDEMDVGIATMILQQRGIDARFLHVQRDDNHIRLTVGPFKSADAPIFAYHLKNAGYRDAITLESKPADRNTRSDWPKPDDSHDNSAWVTFPAKDENDLFIATEILRTKGIDDRFIHLQRSNGIRLEVGPFSNFDAANFAQSLRNAGYRDARVKF